MYRILVICIIAAFTLSSSEAHAQNWGNQLKNKMLKKLENKAEQKIDKAADRALKETVDDTEEAVKKGATKDKKQKEATIDNESQQPPSDAVDYEQLNQLMEQYSNSSNSGNPNVSFEEADLSNVQPSEVIGRLTMQMESYNANGKKKEKESMEITYHIDRFKIAMIPENVEVEGADDMRIILDRKNGTITSLINDKGAKQGVKMKMPKINVEDSDEGNATTDFQITNETKIIDGKKCTKVIAEDEDSKSVMWMTKELNISLSEMLTYFEASSKKKGGSAVNLKDLEGFMIVEGETTNKSSGDVMKIKTKDVVVGKVDQSIFDESGYNVMDMSNGFGNLMNQYNKQ